MYEEMHDIIKLLFIQRNSRWKERFFSAVFDERRIRALKISELVVIDVYASTREDTIVEIEICLS